MKYTEDLNDLRKSIYIGQKAQVRKSDAMWEKDKKKITVVVCEIHEHFIVCQFPGGTLEDFTYSQILTGDGIWLV